MSSGWATYIEVGHGSSSIIYHLGWFIWLSVLLLTTAALVTVPVGKNMTSCDAEHFPCANITNELTLIITLHIILYIKLR